MGKYNLCSPEADIPRHGLPASKLENKLGGQLVGPLAERPCHLCLISLYQRILDGQSAIQDINTKFMPRYHPDFALPLLRSSCHILSVS